MVKINKKLILFSRIFLALFVFISIIAGASYILDNLDEELAKAAVVEPTCQNVAENQTWNPYPINTQFANPILEQGNCQGMPMLSFFPIDTTGGNPREKTIIENQSFSFQIYYNNGGQSGSINSPTVQTEVIKESSTRYRIKAILTGGNTARVTSAQRGGDLILNVPGDTELSIVARSTLHYPDAIERRDDAQNTGSVPYDQVADNTVGSNVSNPIYSRFDGANLSSTNGFVVKDSLEPGFLGYGYILATIAAQTTPAPQNNPPSIPGQEITIIRGQSGSFNPLNPTDPDSDYPISLDTSQLPSWCSLGDTINSQGGGQIILCQAGQDAPTRTEFDITPTDSRGLTGTSGRFIINVIEPEYQLEKICTIKGTNTPCNQKPVLAGDEISYTIELENTTNVVVQNIRIVDDYDETRITNLTNISNAGSDNGDKVNWSNLGNLNPGEKISVSFDAAVRDSVNLGDKITNTTTASAERLPDQTASTEFIIGGALEAVKTCKVADTDTNCSDGELTIGDKITYFIKVTNSTGSEIKNVKIEDTYDVVRLAEVTKFQPLAKVDTETGKVIWEVGNMTTSQTIQARFDATLTDQVKLGDNIQNIALISADDLPDLTVTNIFPTVGPNLTAVKECRVKNTETACNSAALTPGDSVVYNIDVTNQGSSSAENVVIIDTYDSSKLENISNISNNGDLDPEDSQISWELGTIIPNQTKRVTFEATIKQGLATGERIENVALITADNLPEITVRTDFRIEFIVDATPRSGGGVAIFIIASGLLTALFGFWFYKNNPKFSKAFTKARYSQDYIQGSSDSKLKTRNIKKSTIQTSTSPKKAKEKVRDQIKTPKKKK